MVVIFDSEDGGTHTIVLPASRTLVMLPVPRAAGGARLHPNPHRLCARPRGPSTTGALPGSGAAAAEMQHAERRHHG